MSFARTGYLYLLWLAPLLVLVYFVAGLWARRRVARLGDPRLIAALSETRSRTKARWKAGLVALAAVCLALALARPLYGSRLELVRQQGVELMVVLDTSLSMTARDIAPSRLERARLAVSDLIDRLPGVQVGLVPFAGASFVQLPLTTDAEAAKLFLEAVDTRSVSRPGTAIGEALRTAMGAFDQKAQRFKAIVLLTDGEDHGTDPLGAARAAADRGITIYALGFGDPAGEPVPAETAEGYKRDRAGQVVVSRLDEATLRAIADATGGAYYRATPGGAEIETLAGAIGSMETAPLDERVVVQKVERFQIPALLALAALLGEFLLTDRRKAKAATDARR